MSYGGRALTKALSTVCGYLVERRRNRCVEVG